MAIEIYKEKRSEKPRQKLHPKPDVGARQTQPLPRLAYTLDETAKILGVSYISVYRLVQRRKLKCSNALPGRKLVPHTEIENFLARTAE